ITDAGAVAALDSIGTSQLDADAVTYEKMQNIAADDVLLGNISGAGGVVAEITPTQIRSMINVADGADVTNSTSVNAAGAVMNSDYGTATILVANSASTPTALALPTNSIVGRDGTAATAFSIGANETIARGPTGD